MCVGLYSAPDPGHLVFQSGIFRLKKECRIIYIMYRIIRTFTVYYLKSTAPNIISCLVSSLALIFIDVNQ